MSVEEIISDEEIERVHGNANFGSMKKRDVVNQGVLKCASGYYQGATSTKIITEHGLITKKYTLTPKGKMYLWEAFCYKNSVQMVEEKRAKMKFRKIPVEVEAVRWTGNNLKDVILFTGLHPSALKWTWEQYQDVVKSEGLKIFTLEGTMMADIGDWIIRGVKGEFYPCKPDIFEQTYEEVK